METFENENFTILKIKMGPLLTNCYLIFNKSCEAVLIDFADFNQKLFDIFKINNLNLKFVLLTHGHFDHIMGLEKFFRKFDSNCCVWINELDKVLLDDSIKNASFDYNFRLDLSKLNLCTFSENDEFDLDDRVKFKAIATPGHTSGSSSFLLNDKFLFTGDFLFKNGVGRTDLFSGSFDQMAQTINKFKKMNGNFVVLPGHGPVTNLANELENNPYF